MDRIDECRRRVAAIDKENGDLQSRLHDVEKQLQLTRSRISGLKLKSESSPLSNFVVIFLVILFSIMLMFK